MSDLDIEERLSRFVCQRCGVCCKGDGVVSVKDHEIAPVAEALGLSPEDFLAQYTCLTEWGERWLVDKQIDGERWCVFLDRLGAAFYACRIQKAKPAQCRGFPFTWRNADIFEWCKGLGSG